MADGSSAPAGGADGTLRSVRALPPNPNLLAAGALIDELIRGGLRDVCVSPGSRSAPLTLACAARTELTLHVHIDERSAAFFALGRAKAARRPVALVCTSGSAAANYHPAMMEATEAGVPLVVLGADRPPRLVDSGANQTAQQVGLFGPHALVCQPVEPPRVEGRWLRWLRGRACRMLEIATTTPGPVHFNLAFEEPLSPAPAEGAAIAALAEADPVAVFGRPGGVPFAGVVGTRGKAVDFDGRLAGGRGLLVAGPLDATPAEAAAVQAFVAKSGVPLLADPLSGLRGVDGALGAYDLFLRSAAVGAALRPDWVIRLGREPTSKPLFQWLGSLDVPQFVVDRTGRRDDPSHGGPTYVRATVEAALAGAEGLGGDAEWAQAWRDGEAAARAEIEAAAGDWATGFAGQGVVAVAESLGAGDQLWVASSMAVRDVDAFLPAGSAVRVLGSRGVSGIDGTASSAFGAAAGGAWTVALMGDLAALHDVGGLAAVPRLGAAATLVVVNDGGGGIFEFLPLAATDAPLELFTTPHELTFEAAAQQFGLGYSAPADDGELAAALAAARESGRAWLIELRVDAESGRRARLALRERAAAAAAAALGWAEPELRITT